MRTIIVRSTLVALAVAIASMLAACASGMSVTAAEERAASATGSPAIASAEGTKSVDGFTLTSEAVVDGELLAEYQGEQKDAQGREDSIPLSWTGVPEGTGSLAVIMHHFPKPDDTSTVNSYLLLWDIDPSVTSIAHGQADDGPWFMGANKDGKVVSYTSPNSKSPGTKEYTITVYALSETPASLPSESTAAVTYDVLTAAIHTVDVLGAASLNFAVSK